MLTLEHFVLKARGLNLYRAAIRASRAIPDPVARKETISWIRAEFEQTAEVCEVEALKSRLAVIRRDLKEILPSIGAKMNGKI
ncbi:hypothetical protein Clacol_008040 [Clathrus columnatus]|uniref:Complex 1 LYR protein domain-containing protein n=1 Tax=Clathrus columnatus TaxID=1419009 RepID=A0AAV5AM60_9AGAM|nr:hypothetical protein Clacol_008040 [Clathrus columnatus]